MRRTSGFTLIEMAVVIGIIAVLAAAAVISTRAAARNAGLSGSTGDITNRVFALRMAALSDGVERLLVVVDAPGSDASACGAFNSAPCARVFVLRDPSAGWSLDAFNPAQPGGSGTSTANVVEQSTLSRGVHLDVTVTAAQAPAIPAPFTGIVVNDAELVGTGTCASRNCFALRFGADGRVMPVYAVSTTPAKTGLAFVLSTDRENMGAAGQRKEVLVTFPAGIVRVFTF